MIGKRISHYEIVKKIGEGGMGEVFLARDTRLGRNVALKFVPDSIHDNEAARARLLREATAASKLNHANIVGLYDIDQADGRDFIVMEYVEGRPLRNIVEGGEIDTEQAIELTRQICRALGAAHDREVIHRDIKSENVLVTAAGEVKVLDFGLAKIEGAAGLTEAGSTVGTVAYMSPEQVQGQPVDRRSDLFSLGVLLYEMLTGRQPFRGDHRAAVSYAIVHEEPEPVVRYKSGVPGEVQRIVDKLLRKDRETRYQTAAGVLADLEGLEKPSPAPREGAARSRWAVPGAIGFLAVALVVAGYLVVRDGQGGGDPGDAGRVMIAVLPFENLGPSQDEYFADGITEEITARLASVRDLGVIARSSILQYKETDKSIAQIGDELEVQYILEGTVRWQHGEDGTSRVRVTPQLIRVSDATHVWADVYDEPMTAVFDVQSDIAMNVTDEFNVALLTPERETVEAKPTDDLEAYDYYLQGSKYFFDAVGPPDIRIASDLFQKAVVRDPKFAEAWAMLAVTHINMYWLAEDRTEDHIAPAARALENATRLDPNSFYTRMATGYFYYQVELDYGQALEQFEIAKGIKPGAMDPYASIGYVQRRQGKWESCLESLSHALALDPRSSQLAYEIGETMVDLSRYEQAAQYFDRALALTPDMTSAYVWKFEMHVYQGDLETARRMLESTPDAPWFTDLAWSRLHMLERNSEKSIETLKASRVPAVSTHFGYTPIDELIAHAYRALGDSARARAHYDAARERLEPLVASEPDDARFHSALGIAYAGVGRDADAIREGKLGIELMPVSKDSKRGPPRHYDMALIYMLTGDAAAAIEELGFILSRPAAPTRVPLLRIDPTWDALRGHPRFRRLVE